MSKVEFYEKLQTLRRYETALQKDIIIFLQKKDVQNSRLKSNIEDIQNSYEKEQMIEISKFQSDLQKACNAIAMFSRELEKPGPDLILRIKTIMESIESQLSSIKNYQMSIYDNLMTLESSLSADLALFDKEIYKYEQHHIGHFQCMPSKVRSQTAIQHNLHPAIIAFDRYVTEHGQIEKWGEFEHQLFLNHYHNTKSDARILNSVKQGLPLKSHDDILKHVTWFRKYEDLEKARRDALKEWRNTKNSKREVGLQNIDKKSRLEEVTNKKKKLFDKERYERLTQLNAYKVQKELHRVMQEEEDLKMKIAETEKDAKRKEYIKSQKGKALLYKEKKQQETEQADAERLEQQKQFRNQKKVTQNEILTLHAKNMRVLERKQMMEQQKILQEFEKQKNLEKLKSQVKVEVKRDPSRLLQKTQGQINREKDNSKCVNPVVGSRNMPHRAMPSWRRGL